MDREKSPTLNGWPTESSAFGLYLLVGMVLALIVIGAFGLLDRRTGAEKERNRPAIAVESRSTPSGTGAGGRAVPGMKPTVKKPVER